MQPCANAGTTAGLEGGGSWAHRSQAHQSWAHQSPVRWSSPIQGLGRGINLLVLPVCITVIFSLRTHHTCLRHKPNKKTSFLRWYRSQFPCSTCNTGGKSTHHYCTQTFDAQMLYVLYVSEKAKTCSFQQVFLQSSTYALEDSHHNNLSRYVCRASHFPLTSYFSLKRDQLHVSFRP